MATRRELKRKALAAHRSGDLEEALGLYMDVLDQTGGDSSDIHGNIGAIYFELGEITNAKQFLDQGLEIAGREDNAVTASAINRYLGRVHRYQGQLHKAVACFKESERLLTQLNRKDKLLSTILALGETYLEMRQRVEAEQYLYQAMNLALKANDKKRGAKAQELLQQLKEVNTLDTLAMAEVSALSLERLSLAKMREVNTAINAQKPIEDLLALIVDKAIELTQAGRGFLILEEDGQLVMGTARATGSIDLDADMSLVAASLVERCRNKKEPVLLESIRDHKSLALKKSILMSGINSVLSVPLKRGDDVTGLFYLDAPDGGTQFSPSDMESLALFSVQATIAMDTARLLEENREHRKRLEQDNKQLNSKVADQGREIRTLRDHLQALGDQSVLAGPDIIGESPRMRKLFQLVNRVADTDLSVIIFGESGTGKELVARALHAASSRRDKPFVSENCGAIPHDLLESVLFGHVRGAFTGAIADKDGLFTMADGGTLFLDEIGEMPLDLQKSLLRALQEGEIRPVGATDNIAVDVRVVCATNRNLKEEVTAKRFREDLYYRLEGILVDVPALRDRSEDIPLLVNHFLTDHPGITVDLDALESLKGSAWPGNVRQLENECRRWIAMGYETVTSDRLGPDISGNRSTPVISGLQWKDRVLKDVVQDAVDLIEKEVIIAVLENNAGRKAVTARELGVSRPTLDAKLKRLGIE